MSRNIEGSRRRGQSMVLFTLGLMALMGMVALAVDMGWVYNKQRQWQNAVTAAAIAGYQQLKRDQANGTGVAQLGLFNSTATNDCDGGNGTSSIQTVSGAYSSSSVVNIIKAYASANGFTVQDSMIKLGPDRVVIDGLSPVGLFVAPMYGLPKVDVRAAATVINGKLSANQASMIPLGMPHGDVLDLDSGVQVNALPAAGFTPGQEYILKLGQGGDDRNRILVPMDASQAQPKLAYGAAYWALGTWTVQWLLNYRGGSFLFPSDPRIEAKLNAMGVTHQTLHVDPCSNTDEVSPVLNAAASVLDMFVKPRVAVYSSNNGDPVMKILEAAQIPYGAYQPGPNETYDASKNTYFFDNEVLTGQLSGYDWLHTHHEDFTGEDGNGSASDKTLAKNLGYANVKAMKQDVAWTIHQFVNGGHHLFAACYATETLDESLAARAKSAGASGSAMYNDTFAFTGFDGPHPLIDDQNSGAFTLQDMTDPMQQDDTSTVQGGGGRTTSFSRTYIKPGVKQMGIVDGTTAKYISGTVGTGTFTFYAGHQPAKDQGERLVLNNVLLGSKSPSALSRQQQAFGPVDLDPTDNVSGSANYKMSLASGYGGALNVGQTIQNEMGNLSNETHNGVVMRWSADPSATWQNFAASSPRVVTLPLVSPAPTRTENTGARWIYDYKSRDAVTVNGFAQFLISNVPTKTPARTDNGPVKVGQVRGIFLRYVVKP